MRASILLLLATALSLAACSPEADIVPGSTAAPREAAHSGPPDRSWLHSFTLGTKLGSNGGIAPGATETQFEIGQHIYVAMRLRDAPVGTPVRVVWRGPEKDALGQETKTVRPGQDFLNFAADSGNLLEGKSYTVEVWVNRMNLTQLEFEVVPPSSG